MVYLYDRKAVLDVGTLRIENLSIDFTIQYANQNFGKAEITVYNLSTKSRQIVEGAALEAVSLSVGYADTSLDRIFKGSVREAFSVHEKNDWVTTLRTGDGDKAPKARLTKGYRKGVSKETMWTDLANAMGDAGIGLGNAIKNFDLAEFKDGIKEFIHGGAAHGDAYAQIRKLARSANLDVRIQDEELVVTKIGEPLDTEAVVLSPRSGLVGNPRKGVNGTINVRSLIIPGLRPKRVVKIQSPTVEGFFVVKTSKYTGQTRGADWYVDLECIPK